MFSSFYDALNATREYHMKFPNASSDYIPKVIQEEINVPFSGEEIFGKYLDLHTFYLRYCNLPNVPAKDQDYLQYLDKFNSFFFISETSKNSKIYVSYVNDLWEYLSGFFSRVQPLVELDLKEWREEFERKWTAGKISGWKPRTTKTAGGGNMAQPQALRLGLFNHPSELEALGMERLKEALEAMGLKCGGTLKDRAERLWSVRGKKPEEIPQKLKAKPSASKANNKQQNGNGNHDAEGGSGAVASTDVAKEVRDVPAATLFCERAIAVKADTFANYKITCTLISDLHIYCCCFYSNINKFVYGRMNNVAMSYTLTMTTFFVSASLSVPRHC
jgi:splicing factor 3A subunit 3